jgi:hypothetical protein
MLSLLPTLSGNSSADLLRKSLRLFQTETEKQQVNAERERKKEKKRIIMK